MTSRIDKNCVNGAEHNDEALEQQPTHGTYIEKDQAVNLSQGHREYLVKRHGTLNLDPIPAFGDTDPYNWPQWKVCRSLLHRLATVADDRVRKSQIWCL